MNQTAPYTANVPQLQTSALIREFTPAQITANQSDYAPSGNETYNVWRLSTDASRDITGMVGGLYGTGEQVRLLINVGTQNIVLKHEAAGSQAANRFSLVNSQDQTINPNDVALCRYDVASSRWRVLLGLDYAAIAALAARVTTLETSLATDEANIAANVVVLGDHETRIEHLETDAYGLVVVSSGQQLTSNSTTFQNVTTMKIPGLANQVFEFTLRLVYLSTLAADFKYQFTVPAGALLLFSTSNYTDATGTTAPIGSAGASAPLTAAGTAGNVLIVIQGQVSFGATAGDMQLQAAQNTATVETTDFVVAGTNLSVRRIL